jgi:hypothetical protein
MRLALGEALPAASPTQPGKMTPPMSSNGEMSQHSMNMK